MSDSSNFDTSSSSESLESDYEKVVQKKRSKKRKTQSPPKKVSKIEKRKKKESVKEVPAEEIDISKPGSYRDLGSGIKPLSVYIGDDWYLKVNRFNNRNYIALRKFTIEGRAQSQGATIPLHMIQLVVDAVDMANKHVNKYKRKSKN